MSGAISKHLLEVNSLRKEFPVRSRGRTGGEPGAPVVAVRDVSLTLDRGEILGIVGESGSGKTTLGRIVLGLIAPTSGSVVFEGDDVTYRTPRERRALTRDIQVIFQDPYGSLNPRQRVEDVIREPLDIHKIGTPAERSERVHEVMEQVVLADRYRRAYPHELSGGLRQRVGIAAALVLNPKIVVADEPVSALDVSVQAQIIDLLARLQRETSVGMLFISHDLGVVHEISDRVAVMRRGEIVEYGDVETIYTSPRHPYTEALLSAILPVDPGAPFNPITLKDDHAVPAAE
ncbi:MAG TPA: ATP-binding cassette domain-containing protein [Streptosporangiaceae bacterium]|jgi:ABC-type glutathione transport system ATPase component